MLVCLFSEGRVLLIRVNRRSIAQFKCINMVQSNDEIRCFLGTPYVRFLSK